MRRWLVMVVALTMVAIACGGDSGDIQIEDAWARTSPRMQDAGAVYMTITGGDDADALVGAAVDSSVAMMAEVHESSMDDEGMMSMQEVPAIDIPSGGEVSLEPGGFHVMLMQLAKPLEDGDEFTVTLEFENAGEVEVDVTVRDE